MKKVFYILIALASLYIMNNLVHSIYSLWQKKDLITQAKVELAKQQNTNEKLQDQLKEVKRKDFIEEEARDKLFMVRGGEQVVILPEGQQQQMDKGEGTPQQSKKPVFQQWLDFFSLTL